MEPNLKGVLIGCGQVTRTHLTQWQQVPDVAIGAVCDLDGDRARERAAAFGIDRVYTDHRQMLAEEKPDFVDIATPPASHAALVADSAAAGCHVLCQKPVASSLDELDAMAAACRQAGVRFMVNENFRFQPWFRRMRERIDTGAIGQPFYARFWNRARASLPVFDFGDQTELFAAMERFILFEMGIHYLDTVRYLMGEPESLFASGRRVSPHARGEDAATVLLRYPEATALVDLSWASLSESPCPEPVLDQVFTVEGTEGTLHFDLDGVLVLVTDHARERESFSVEGIDNAFGATFRHFIDGLRKGTPFETDAAQTRRTMQLVFGAYASLESGQAVYPG